MIKVGDKVRFKGGRFDGRTFDVGGVNGLGYDAETKESGVCMLSVSFRGFGRGCHMNVPESEMERVE